GLAQHAEAEANVLQELLDPHETPRLPHVFFHTRHIPELPHRRMPRLFRPHSPLEVVLRLPLDVLADVLFQLFQHPVPPPHDRPRYSAGLRIRAIAPASL